MKQELVDEWLRRLRSGDYQQGHQKLCRMTDSGPTFCCLGVLAEIAVDQGLAEKIVYGPFFKYKTKDESVASISSLTQGLQKWAGILSYGDYSSNPRKNLSLATDNDMGKNFWEIAEIIERNHRKFSLLLRK